MKTQEDETRRWLMRLAGAIDGWPFRQDDDLGPGARVTTPTTAVAILVHRDIANATVRRAVVAALPRVLSEDWTEAAYQIRAAAERIRPSSSGVGRDVPGPDRDRVIAIALPEPVWELATDYIETNAPYARMLLARIRRTSRSSELGNARRTVRCTTQEAQLLLSVFTAAANAYAQRGNDHRLRLAGDGCRQITEVLRQGSP